MAAQALGGFEVGGSARAVLDRLSNSCFFLVRAACLAFLRASPGGVLPSGLTEGGQQWSPEGFAIFRCGAGAPVNFLAVAVVRGIVDRCSTSSSSSLLAVNHVVESWESYKEFGSTYVSSCG